MLAVGDTTGLSVSTEVDEIEVTKVKKGSRPHHGRTLSRT
jgi:hypothetical protein